MLKISIYIASAVLPTLDFLSKILIPVFWIYIVFFTIDVDFTPVKIVAGFVMLLLLLAFYIIPMGSFVVNLSPILFEMWLAEVPFSQVSTTAWTLVSFRLLCILSTWIFIFFLAKWEEAKHGQLIDSSSGKQKVDIHPNLYSTNDISPQKNSSWSYLNSIDFKGLSELEPSDQELAAFTLMEKKNFKVKRINANLMQSSVTCENGDEISILFNFKNYTRSVKKVGGISILFIKPNQIHGVWEIQLIKLI